MPDLPALSPDATPVTAPDFDAILDALDGLTRAHVVRYRIEVGALILRAFYDGDMALYYARDPARAPTWARFLEHGGERLGDLGLSEPLLRQCVLAYGVVEHLDPRDVDRLLFSHYVALAPLDDAASRRTLGALAAAEGWTVRQTRDAVARVQRGLWVDGDPDLPGLQPEPPPDEGEGKRPQVGRVVNQVERVVDELVAARQRWDLAPRDRMTRAHRERVTAALEQLRALVAEIEGSLG